MQHLLQYWITFLFITHWLIAHYYLGNHLCFFYQESLFYLVLHVNYFVINVKLKLVRSLKCHFAIELVFSILLPLWPFKQLMQLFQLQQLPSTLFSIHWPVIVSSSYRAQSTVIFEPQHLFVTAAGEVAVAFSFLPLGRRNWLWQLELQVMVVVRCSSYLPFFVI